MATTCPKCGSTIPPGGIFCPGCGSEITASKQKMAVSASKCPKCNSPVPVGGKFCPSCGEYFASTRRPWSIGAFIAALIVTFLFFITIFILPMLGLVGIFTALPTIFVGITALKREPRGKVYAWISIGLCSSVLVIGLIASVLTFVALVRSY